MEYLLEEVLEENFRNLFYCDLLSGAGFCDKITK